jgi:hypothetical protein
MGRWWIGVAFAFGCHAGAEDPPAAETPVAVVKPAVAPAQPAPVPAKRPRAAPLLPELEPDDIITAKRPTGREVAAMIARGYDPIHLVLTARVLNAHLIAWTRSFDGVPVVADAKSVDIEGAWHTRFYREVVAPEAVKREALITPAEAKAISGLVADRVELVYRPVFGQRQRPGTPGTNAMDFGMVIERYDLVYSVEQGGGAVLIDAYSGIERGRFSGMVD